MSRKPSSSLFAALALGASIGLLLPALIVGGLFIGLREAQVAEQSLQRDLDAKLDVLASSLPELLWNLDAVAARVRAASDDELRMMIDPDSQRVSHGVAHPAHALACRKCFTNPGNDFMLFANVADR